MSEKEKPQEVGRRAAALNPGKYTESFLPRWKTTGHKLTADWGRMQENTIGKRRVQLEKTKNGGYKL